MSDQVKSLAAAWDVQRANSKVKRVSSPMQEESIEARPDSLADAILAKRRAAAGPSDEELVMSIPDLPEEEPIKEEKDISINPEPLPFPTSRADAIRRKLKAIRGE